jgi:hypothetical protein
MRGRSGVTPVRIGVLLPRLLIVYVYEQLDAPPPADPPSTVTLTQKTSCGWVLRLNPASAPTLFVKSVRFLSNF